MLHATCSRACSRNEVNNVTGMAFEADVRLRLMATKHDQNLRHGDLGSPVFRLGMTAFISSLAKSNEGEGLAGILFCQALARPSRSTLS